jgi:transposase-like protein
MSISPSFSPTCPSCKRSEGVANSVGFTGEQRTVGYRCPLCLHTWTSTDYLTPLVMQPVFERPEPQQQE